MKTATLRASTTASFGATIVALLSALVSAVAQAGFYYEATTTTSGDGANQTMRVTGWIDGSAARVEFIDGGGRAGLFQEGSYLVTRDAGSTVYLVNPAERSYSPIDLDAIFGFAGAMLDVAGGTVQMEFKDLVNEKLGEEPGESLLGYATTRYEFHTAYTMSVSVLGFGRSTTFDSNVEVWCTDEIDAEGFRVWLQPNRFRTGNADFDGLIEQLYQGIDCLPLRTVASTTNTGSGRDTTSTSETLVTTLREEAVDVAVFDLPADFTEVSFLPQITIPPQGDAGSDDSGGRERPRLRDLLRR